MGSHTLPQGPASQDLYTAAGSLEEANLPSELGLERGYPCPGPDGWATRSTHSEGSPETLGVSHICSLPSGRRCSPRWEERGREDSSSAPLTHTYTHTCLHTLSHTRTHTHTHASAPSTAHWATDPGHIARREVGKEKEEVGTGLQGLGMGSGGTLFRGDLQIQVTQKNIKDARQSLPLTGSGGMRKGRGVMHPLIPHS